MCGSGGSGIGRVPPTRGAEISSAKGCVRTSCKSEEARKKFSQRSVRGFWKSQQARKRFCNWSQTVSAGTFGRDPVLEPDKQFQEAGISSPKGCVRTFWADQNSPRPGPSVGTLFWSLIFDRRSPEFYISIAAFSFLCSPTKLEFYIPIEAFGFLRGPRRSKFRVFENGFRAISDRHSVMRQKPIGRPLVRSARRA